jgi:hypothetical protein
MDLREVSFLLYLGSHLVQSSLCSLALLPLLISLLIVTVQAIIAAITRAKAIKIAKEWAELISIKQLVGLASIMLEEATFIQVVLSATKTIYH